VVLDIMVTVQLYEEGLIVLCILSAVVLILASVIYTLIVTVFMHDDWRSNRWMLVRFICVFPVSQLVPVILLLGAYNVKFVDPFMSFLDLDSGDSAVAPFSQYDTTRARFKKRIKAHIGFYAECVAEAIPSSLIQITAMFMSDTLRSSPVNIASILVSAIVIVSKGYLVSFSIDTRTFVFNCASVAADIFGAFAIVTWLAYALRFGGGGLSNVEWTMLVVLAAVPVLAIAGIAIMGFIMSLEPLIRTQFNRRVPDNETFTSGSELLTSWYQWLSWQPLLAISLVLISIPLAVVVTVCRLSWWAIFAVSASHHGGWVASDSVCLDQLLTSWLAASLGLFEPLH
jgi:hypothetical protein